MLKNHYYVLVFTKDGPKYVTDTEYQTAHWHACKSPEEMSKGWAEDITYGLNLNGFPAVTVVSKWEIENQPYLYGKGKFIWTKE